MFWLLPSSLKSGILGFEGGGGGGGGGSPRFLEATLYSASTVQQSTEYHSLDPRL